MKRIVLILILALFACGTVGPVLAVGAETGGDAAVAHAEDSSDEHWSLVSQFVPRALRDNIRNALGPSWLGGQEVYGISHKFLAFVVLLLVVGLGLAARRRLQGDEGVLPPTRWGAYALFDVIIEFLLDLMCKMMPREKALDALPMIAAFFIFILVSNLLALVPGFLPPTDSLNTTAMLGILAFLFYNYQGIKNVGVVMHFGHLTGPVWWLSWLIFPIEVISHLARPLSLALRLFGNMYGDHKVLTIFLGFHLLFVPLPVMCLGIIVCLVQALVFTLLTIVYVAMASEDHDHGDHAQA